MKTIMHLAGQAASADVFHMGTVEAGDGVGHGFLLCEPVILSPGGEDVVACQVMAICTTMVSDDGKHQQNQRRENKLPSHHSQ